MKIELIEEIKFNEDPWYCVKLDGAFIKGSYRREVAEEYYAKLLEDVNALNAKQNVLKSQEVDVHLKF